MCGTERSAQVRAAATTAFLQGDQWAYLAGIVAVLLGAVLVFLKFPRRDTERRLLDEYHAADAGSGGASTSAEPPAGRP